MTRRTATPLALLMVMLVALTIPPLQAQSPSPAPAPVLTLNQDRLFQQSQYGKRIKSELEAASQHLATENRQIESKLIAEERDLTDLRPTMEAEAFRALANDFDKRVEAIRDDQEQKSRSLIARSELAQKQFFEQAIPVLLEIVQDRGAVAILDNRALILASEQIDITDHAITRIDAILGAGAGLPPVPGAQLESPPGPVP